MFKNYKKLYKQQLNNNKIMNERNLSMQDRWMEYQEKTLKELRSYKETIARLTIELEDTTGFLNQFKEANKVLKKEITKLRRKNTIFKKKLGVEETKIKPKKETEKNGN